MWKFNCESRTCTCSLHYQEKNRDFFSFFQIVCRMILWSLSPSPCSTQNHPKIKHYFWECMVQTLLELRKIGANITALGSLFQCQSTYGDKSFPNTQLSPSLTQLHAIPLGSVEITRKIGICPPHPPRKS